MTLPISFFPAHAGGNWNQVPSLSGRKARFAVLATLGSLAAILTVAGIQYLETQRAQGAFSRKALARMSSMISAAQEHVEIVHALAAYHAGSPNTGPGDFQLFTSSIVEGKPGIVALQWVPRVRAEEVPSFETKVRRSGQSDFRILERTDVGGTTGAASRPEHFPVLHSEPRPSSRYPPGFDLASDPDVVRVLDAARDSGALGISERLSLGTGPDRAPGVLVAYPVYRGTVLPASIEDRRRRLRGFAVGLFQVGPILSKRFTTVRDHRYLSPSGIDLYVFDLSAQADKSLLHLHSSRTRSGPAPSLSYRESTRGVYSTIQTDVGDRTWTIVAKPVNPSFGVWRMWQPWLCGLAVLSVTLLVIVRTREIHLFNQALQDEVAVRRHAESTLTDQNQALALVQKVTASANAAESLDEALRACIGDVCAFTGWPVGHAFGLADDGSGDLVSLGIWHLSDHEAMGEFTRRSESARIAPGDGLVGQVLTTGEPIWISDVNEARGYLQASNDGQLPVKAAFAFPVVIGERVVAVLEFYNALPLAPDPALLTLAAQIGALVGRAAERALAARALREREELMRLITDHLPAMIIYVDRGLHLRFVNRVGETWLADTRDALIGRKVPDILGNTAFERVRPAIERVLDGKTERSDRSIAYPDGHKRYVDMRLVPHLGADGRAIGYFGIILDVTERKEMEAQLSQAQKLEAIGRLASGIAHEINTPSQYIGDNLRFLVESHSALFEVLSAYRKVAQEAENPEDGGTALREALDALEVAVEAADLPFILEEIPHSTEQSLEGIQQISHIVQAMKDFSHRRDRELTPLDLNRTIENTVVISRNSWKYTAELETDLTPDLPPVTCHGAEMKQVFLNLIVNAAHAIEARDTKVLGRIRVSSALSDGFVEIRISDSGTGIPASVRDQVFDPFFTTKEVGMGTGQGLSISHDIVVNKHGGRMFFETEEGVGTTFVVELPVDQPAITTQAAE